MAKYSNSVILEVTKDIYSLPARVFLNTKEMADKLNISVNNARCRINRKQTSKFNTQFIRVYLENENEK